MITRESKLFDPAEVVELCRSYGKMGTIDVVQEIINAWGKQYDDPQWNYYCMLSAIFEAGYIQGKREERRKQAEHILKHSI